MNRSKQFQQSIEPSTIHVAADVVIFTFHNNQLHCLCIERAREPYKNTRALPGGKVRDTETSRQTARRVLRDKAGVDGVFLEQLRTFDSLHRDPRGRTISIAYYALVPFDDLVIEVNDQTEKPALFPISNLTKLAFDHADIIEDAASRLRNKIGYSNVLFSLLPESFTMAELHATYEAILGKKLDKPNFRKKFLSLGLIEETGAKTTGVKHRPAELYTFISKELIEFDRWL